MRDYKLEAEKYGVPENTAYSLVNYLEMGVPVGGFLQSCISNDLMGALSKADIENRNALWNIGMFMYNSMPMNSIGSAKVYQEWIKKGGLYGKNGVNGRIEEVRSDKKR